MVRFSSKNTRSRKTRDHDESTATTLNKTRSGVVLLSLLLSCICLMLYHLTHLEFKNVFCTNMTFDASYSSDSTKQPQEQDKETIDNGNNDHLIHFHGFNNELIPSKTILDMNIGTNNSPFGSWENRHRILVDPLFHICELNAKSTKDTTSFCLAVSNYTGFDTFF